MVRKSKAKDLKNRKKISKGYGRKDRDEWEKTELKMKTFSEEGE